MGRGFGFPFGGEKGGGVGNDVCLQGRDAMRLSHLLLAPHLSRLLLAPKSHGIINLGRFFSSLGIIFEFITT